MSKTFRAVCTALFLAGFSLGADAPKPAGDPHAVPAAESEGRETTLSDVVQLTKGFDRAGEAYFSPDGKWFIFQATPKGETHYAMYVAKLKKDGDKIIGADAPTRISPPNSRNTCGWFSPDGKGILFGSTAGKEKPDDESAAGYQRSGGNYRWDFPEGMELFFAADGVAQVEAAIAKGKPYVNLAKKPLTDNNAYDAEGSFSPDGKSILFGSLRTGDAELYAMKADGTGSVQLTNAKGYDGGPFFSPDGKRILYRSDRKGNDLLQVFVADLAFDAQGHITGSSNEKQLTNDGNVNWGPDFHPGGKHIVFATSVHGHGNYEVYAMRDDGSHRVRITYKAGFDGLPVFSADGKHMMWSSKRSENETTQVFVAKFTPPADW